MKCSWNKINLGWRPGDIYTMTKEAVEIAKLIDSKVSFEFNGISVNVSGKSDVSSTATKAIDAVKNGVNTIYGEGF